MKDLDQFIDEQLFKQSDQYKLIYESVLELVETKKKPEKPAITAVPPIIRRKTTFTDQIGTKPAVASTQVMPPESSQEVPKEEPKSDKKKKAVKICDDVIVPTDIGSAAEYSLALSIIKFLRQKNYLKIPNIKFNGSNTSEKCINDTLEYFLPDESERTKLHGETYKFVQANIDDWSLKNQIDIKNIDFLNLVGLNQKEKKGDRYFYKTSADLYIVSNGIEKGISVKRGSEYFYRGGSVRPSQEFLKNQTEKELYQSAGGGYKKLYSIFDIDSTKVEEYFNEKTFSDREIWSSILIEDFCNQTNNIYNNEEKIKSYFYKLKNLITRYDEKVFLLVDILEPKKVLYPQLLDKFINHIGKITNKKSTDARIFSIAENIKNFQFENIDFSNIEQTQLETIKTLISKNSEESKKFYQDFMNDIKSLNEEEIPNSLKKFIGDYKSSVSNFEKIVNKTINDIKSDPKIIFIKSESVKGEKQQIRIGAYSGLFAIGKLNELFFYLASNKEFKNLEKCFLNLLDISENLLKNSKYIEKFTEPSDNLSENIISSLVLEALNEKELSKITSKISSANPEGFVSVLPSNKTPNSLAVRFEDDESLEKGISKIKSALKSAGYKLHDERILKFDDKRDTTNVMKDGEVIAKVFYRVDIAEREGLAYEHIIGFVLTGKETDQLKNRIDLGPDASREDVLEKLKSDKYKHLFQSALEAKPIIINKIGKIASAESVGSTNNKADFILKTVDGKTAGLSAKYATGEKDNEYKMNKVLGFGTEDDSLVRNPKGDPWWVVGRKTFLEKLKTNTGNFKDKTYDPDYETLDAPAWMVSAKEKNPDVYKETMEQVYGIIRNVLTKNLRRMKPQDLMAFVREADVGKDEENKNYDIFLKVKDGPSGLTVSEVSLENDGSSNFNPQEIVVQDRSDIIIQIPGMEKLTINSVKFKSDMLSSKAGDLKIKTR
jgi:hypothetical protein